MRTLRVKLLLGWLVFAVLFVAATNLIAFRTALDGQFQQLRQTLMSIASTAALHIDGDAHARIPPEPDSVTLPAYQVLAEQLRAIQQANAAIRYVYTMAPDAHGRWHYLVDAAPTDSPEFSQPGEPYDVTRYPAMAAAVRGPSADPALTTDEWGPLLSGYAPIRNRAGEVVGILGIDMSGAHVARTQDAIRRWRLVVLVLGLLGAVLLGALLAQRLTRPLRGLAVAADRIGRGDLAHRVPVTSHDEVAVVGRAFNHMAGLLASSLKQLQEHVLSSLESLAVALEAKDRYTRGHSERVRRYAVKIAEQMGLPGAQVELIRRVALLHDIGKIGIKEEVLCKPAKLSPEEYDHIKTHPDVGYKILAPLKLPEEALQIVRHHHERLDGQGYPAGLRQDQIPLSVTIVTVADSFDAMTGHRPYRPQSLSYTEAAEELLRCSGTQFRLDVVEALLDVLRQEGHLPKIGIGR